jgi:hypothetical protein
VIHSSLKFEGCRPQLRGEVQIPLQIPGRRWESVTMNLIADLPFTSKDHDRIWIVVERLYKTLHVQATSKTVTAEQALLYEHMIFRIMLCLRLIVTGISRVLFERPYISSFELAHQIPPSN